MKVEYKREISTPNEKLIFEINDRVNKYLKNKRSLTETDVAILKIDKETLKDYYNTSNYDLALSSNLTKKIDLLLNEKE